MLDNPAGSSMEELVQRMQANRKQAEQPEPDDGPTGGTDEVDADEADTSQEYDSDESEEYGESDEYDSESEESEELGEAEEPTSYRVKVDGEELEVDLDELTSGYQRDRDYRKKTMELAETRKALEAKEAQLAEKLQELESYVAKQDQEIDWDELRETDTAEYLRQKELQEKRKSAASKQRAEIQAKQQEQMQQRVNEEAEKLKKAMGPKWTTEQQQKDFDTANEYLDSLGVSQEERASLVDSRLWKMIFDAAKHQKLMANKGKVKKEVKRAPKSVKPGQRQAPSEVRLSEAKERLRKATKGNDIDAAVALMRAQRGN